MKYSTPPPILNSREVPEKYILDTSAWNFLFDDPQKEEIVAILRNKTILPICVVISEMAAIEYSDRRLGLLQFVKTIGQDNRPVATPNQFIIMACWGFAHRNPTLTINDGDDANGAWIALNKPDLIDDTAQRMALEFNNERESVFQSWNEGLVDKNRVARCLRASGWRRYRERQGIRLEWRYRRLAE